MGPKPPLNVVSLHGSLGTAVSAIGLNNNWKLKYGSELSELGTSKPEQ